MLRRMPPAVLAATAIACLVSVLIPTPRASAQTALDEVPAYAAPFGQGVNFGWFANWTDDDLARLAMGDDAMGVAGVGANAVRPGLFAHFLEEFGYDIRREEFALYSRLGTSENVVIVGYPSEAQRGDEEWCDGQRSGLFRGMWDPIWDDGADGTPYNEGNAYASYLYRAVEEYGDHVRFWEIWNEPDAAHGGGNSWREPGDPLSWFDGPIDPCEMKFHAPVRAYVRMLRISYEVIKRLQPDDYVAIGGVGTAGFLDAVLRTTDEPTEGRVTPDYPHAGGAYFDALSFHVYPHLEDAFREWDNDRQGWDYIRSSDRGILGFAEKMLELRGLCEDYGFDGSRHPRKVELCTETNLPRRGFDNPTAAIASPRMQRNFIVKVAAKSRQWGLAQLHPYQLAEAAPRGRGAFEFDAMGMYRYIDDRPELGAAVRTEAGEAYRAIGTLFGEAWYDGAATEAMALPAGADGVAFGLPTGGHGYLVWAIAEDDGEDSGRATYALPTELQAAGLVLTRWDVLATRRYEPLGETLELTADPVFLIPPTMVEGLTSDTTRPADAATLGLWPNPTAAELHVSVPRGDGAEDPTLELYDAAGRRLAVPVRVSAVAPAAVSLRADVAGLPSGSYAVRVRNGGESYRASFVKVD